MRATTPWIVLFVVLLAGCGGGGGGGVAPPTPHMMVFVDDGSFSPDVWTMNSDGTSPQPRFTNAAQDSQPWLHRATGDVYYIKDSGGVWRIDPSSGIEAAVMTTGGTLEAMTYRKQSDQLVVAIDGILYIITKTPYTQTLKVSTGGAVRRLRMSEDGSHILAVVLVGSLWHVFRYEFAGNGQVTLVTSNNKIGDAIENAVTGEAYVMNADTLVRVPVGGGVAAQLVQVLPGASGLDVDLGFSPDYTRLYYAIEATGIFWMPVGGGAGTLIRASGYQIHGGI